MVETIVWRDTLDRWTIALRSLPGSNSSLKPRHQGQVQLKYEYSSDLLDSRWVPTAATVEVHEELQVRWIIGASETSQADHIDTSTTAFGSGQLYD